VVADAVRGLGLSHALGAAAAAAVAVSPLLWDTEAVGLVELPLALWATATLALLWRARRGAGAGAEGEAAAGRSARWLWAPGLTLGFLPWIKQEGLVLGALLGAAAFFVLWKDRATGPGPGPEGRAADGRAAAKWAAGERAAVERAADGRAARWAAIGVPALVLAVAALAMQRFVLPPGNGFFAGDWWRRGVLRLPLVPGIARQALGDLLQSDWLGFWIVLAAATALAAVRRRAVALALAAVVWNQVLIYQLTALFSYLPPADHLNAAFFRICAPLMPLGIVAMAALLDDQATPTPAPAGTRPAGARSDTMRP
jgi:hypothetical protein